MAKTKSMQFAGHNSFHIRMGWLRKAMRPIVDENKEKNRVFWDKQATDYFGIGKNMVASLRYWVKAAGLAEEVRDGKLTIMQPTALGKLINKQDKYFEENGTLWVLHCQLATNEHYATSWYWFFNQFGLREFDREIFVHKLKEYAYHKSQENNEKEVKESSLDRDFECLTRTYVNSRYDIKTTSPEDGFESPLSFLDLISMKRQGAQRRYFIKPSHSEKIDPLIVLYVLKQYQEKKAPDAQSIGFTAAIYDNFSPGKLLLMDEVCLKTCLEKVNEYAGQELIRLTFTAGLNSIEFIGEYSAFDVLEMYYNQRNA